MDKKKLNAPTHFLRKISYSNNLSFLKNYSDILFSASKPYFEITKMSLVSFEIVCFSCKVMCWFNTIFSTSSMHTGDKVSCPFHARCLTVWSCTCFSCYQLDSVGLRSLTLDNRGHIHKNSN